MTEVVERRGSERGGVTQAFRRISPAGERGGVSLAGSVYSDPGLWLGVSQVLGRQWLKLEGITCDFQARRGRRDFSGHSELRLLRSHSLAGHTSQPNLKLCSCSLSQNSPDTQTAGHTFQEPLPGVYSQARVPGFWEGLVQAWLFNGLFKLYTRVTWKTGRIEVPSNAQSLGLIRLEGRQLLCLQDQLTGRNTTQGPCGGSAVTPSGEPRPPKPWPSTVPLAAHVQG